ncbi:hypothetical protein [Streptomyces sp. NBC_01187]|nr:hypothetical protein OG220_19290 [Streptomyces sp. NBC_01187]
MTKIYASTIERSGANARHVQESNGLWDQSHSLEAPREVGIYSTIAAVST